MSDATPPPPPQDPNQGSTPPPPPPPAAPTPPPAAPTPPPPPGGVAPAAPAAGGPVMQNGMGTAALILGILQFFCLGTIGSILAIIFGWIGMKKVKEGVANNGGQAKAGFILGIVGVVLSIITAIIVIIAVIAGGKAVGEMVDVSKNSQTGLADGTYGLVPTSNVNINDERCSFTGAPISAETQEVVGMGDVTVVGTNSAECHFEKGGPSLVMFQVSGGVAKIVSVE